MDPRIKARRIEVRRTEGRRRLQRLLDLGALLVVGTAFAVALRSPLLDVDAVAVVGAERTGAAAVREVLGIDPGDALMDVELAAAGRRVAALPWVAQVRIDRGVDGSVRVAVIERVPAALVGDAAAPMLVDADGRLLGPLADAPAGLPPLVRITGLADRLEPGAYVAPAVEGVIAMAGRLAVAAPGAVAALEITDGDLSAALTDGGVALLGDATQLDAKVRGLVTFLEQVDLTCLDVLDLRLPGSPVLTREEGCS